MVRGVPRAALERLACAALPRAPRPACVAIQAGAGRIEGGCTPERAVGGIPGQAPEGGGAPGFPGGGPPGVSLVGSAPRGGEEPQRGPAWGTISGALSLPRRAGGARGWGSPLVRAAIEGDVRRDYSASPGQWSGGGKEPIRDVLQNRLGITLRSYNPGEQQRIACPFCGGGSDREKSFAVVIENDDSGKTVAKYTCHRATCGEAGVVDNAGGGSRGAGQGHPNHPGAAGSGWSSWPPGGTGAGGGGARGKGGGAGGKKAKAPPTKPDTSSFHDPGAEVQGFFKSRGISRETVKESNVQQAGTAIAFPYWFGNEVVNVKYRSVGTKKFWQSTGGHKVLYGHDWVDLDKSNEIIICEGEMDALSLREAGFPNTVSVPDGAPAKVKDTMPGDPEQDIKYEYIWNCRELLDRATRIVIATDNDAPGAALAEELARRLGRERCHRVTWKAWKADVDSPEQGEFVACKDANEVLMKFGEDALAECIFGAEEYPVKGLYRFSAFNIEIDAYYNSGITSEERGMSTGWKSVDEFYRVVPGDLTVVTGVPNSGKSEWIDALLCNLQIQHQWNFALCSMENKVRDHARKLVEKYIGEPFFTGAYSTKARMSEDKYKLGKEWLDDHFFLIRCEDDELPSVDWVLNLARSAVMRYGIKGLVIDPYNELDHQRPSNMSETEYVSQMLTKIKRFAQNYNVHVWFVAHPRQMRDWKGQAPQLYDISGSAHFVNKCDNGIVVHRNRDPEAGTLDEVTIHVRKVRNKVAGGIGDAKLRYLRDIGRYVDPGPGH